MAKMKITRIIPPLIITLFLVTITHGDLTLTEPINAKSLAMGGTGYAIANDGTALFYNPALLGISNYRWNGGEALYYVNPYYWLPRYYYSLVWQPEKMDRIGFSTYLNYYNDRGVYLTDLNGNVSQKVKTYEFCIAAGAGYNFLKNDILSNSLGISVKYYSGCFTEIHYNAFSIDAGYILQIVNRIRLGLVIKNFGQKIKLFENDSLYGKRDQPILLAAGIGYVDTFNFKAFKLLSISAELTYQDIFDNAYRSDTRSLLTGIDLTFLNTFPVRVGYSRSFPKQWESINKYSFGTGLSLFNHFCFDFFLSFNDNGPKFDDPAYGFSLSITRLLNWHKKDRRWWIIH
jgi:hypothetical protein